MPINCSTIKKKFFLQGEKAYSCSQCGTRFTYRNGLIKHTKLNRCPKKIITPEGETIIKKRSRSFGAASNKAKQGQDQIGAKTNENQSNVTNAASLAGLRSPTSTVPQHFAQSPTAASAASSASALSNDNLSALLETSAEANVPNESQGGNNAAATLFVQDQQIQLHANGDTYGLAVLEDGSLVATPQHKTAPPITSTLPALSASATVGGGVPTPKLRSPATAAVTHTNLSPSVIAALSAATGLPANEIYSWAANLPAGSTVKVTHHFESPPSSQPSSLPPTTGNPALNAAAANGKTALTSIRQTSPTVTTSRLQLQADRLLMDHVLRQQRQQLTLEMANTCHDSLISACVGLPSYQESFAVDPNEILSRERGTKTLMVPPVVIKEEPLTPNMFTNEDELNNNNMEDDHSLSTIISSCGGDFGGGHFNNYIQNQHRSAYPFSDDNISCRPQLPSHINVANSRLLTNHAMSSSLASDSHHMFTSSSSSSSEHSFLSSPTSSMSSSSPTCNTNSNRGAVQNHSQLTSTTSDFDLDEIPVNFLDDMDICAGFNLNDQDFSTMKSIVEQTFKDGRDVLDIISAV